jgi:hypothetical protein
MHDPLALKTLVFRLCSLSARNSFFLSLSSCTHSSRGHKLFRLCSSAVLPEVHILLLSAYVPLLRKKSHFLCHHVGNQHKHATILMLFDFRISGIFPLIICLFLRDKMFSPKYRGKVLEGEVAEAAEEISIADIPELYEIAPWKPGVCNVKLT